jgi:inosine-uridine nucleoside N-ribohydrolase
LLLKSPELDLRLVVGDQGRPDYRARLIAKFLQTAGRTDVPVGVGLDVNRSGEGPQADWVADYKLSDYPGRVHRDGVGAMIETIMRSTEPVTLIAVGPVPNIAEALQRQPAIAQRARLVGMHGSVRRGYGGQHQISAEYNVAADAQACRRVLSAPWQITITPLDTCGLVHLTAHKYQRVCNADDPIASAIIENYRLWAAQQTQPGQAIAADSRSSTLFDTVAVYLAISNELLKIEELPIRVTDDGYTVIDAMGKPMSVATEWKDLGRFEDLLVGRLTGN